MIALLILAQMMQTLPPPSESAKPATSWECDFNDSAGKTFLLSGTFPEIPAGSDPNGAYPVTVVGNGPEPLLGQKSFNGFDYYPETRFYQITFYAPDNGHYVTSMALQNGDKFGLAKITRYMPAPNNQPGTLATIASGNCRATFHPLGFKGKVK